MQVYTCHVVICMRTIYVAMCNVLTPVQQNINKIKPFKPNCQMAMTLIVSQFMNGTFSLYNQMSFRQSIISNHHIRSSENQPMITSTLKLISLSELFKMMHTFSCQTENGSYIIACLYQDRSLSVRQKWHLPDVFKIVLSKDGKSIKHRNTRVIFLVYCFQTTEHAHNKVHHEITQATGWSKANSVFVAGVSTTPFLL